MRISHSGAAAGVQKIHNSKSAVSTAIEWLEPRRLLSLPGVYQIQGEPITIGVPGLKDVTFTADNGVKTTISTIGLTAAIDFSGPAVPSVYQGHAFFPNGIFETVNSIALTDAVPNRATLNIVSAYGTGHFNIGSITGGNLASINAPDVNLTGSLDLLSDKKLVLASVSGAAINLGSVPTVVKIHGVFTGSLTASSLKSLTAFELVQADITTTGPFSKSSLQIGTINGGAGIEQSDIISAGNIGRVSANFIEKSVITAGTDPLAPTGQFPAFAMPASSSVFAEPAVIHTVAIVPGRYADFFNDSVIAAHTIGVAHLAQLGADTGGGLAAEGIASVMGIAPVGSLDRVTLHLGLAQLHTTGTLQSTLSRQGISYESDAGGPQETLVYNLVLGIFR